MSAKEGLNMQKSIRKKIEMIHERYLQLEKEQSDPELVKDHSDFERVGKEMHSLYPVVERYQSYQALEGQLRDAQEMLNGEEAELLDLAKEEITVSQQYQQ